MIAKILFRVGMVLSVIGIGLIAAGIVLSGTGKLVSADGHLLPNYHAALCFLIGLPALWLGCAGTAAVLQRGRAFLAGLVTVAASFVVPWSLHAIGVTWWTYYSSIPAVAVLLAGFILLGLAAVRTALSPPHQVGIPASGKLSLASFRVYFRAVTIGVALGLIAYSCLVSWYRLPPASAYTSSVIVDFEWDSAQRVTVFHVRDSAARNQAWERARDTLIGLQIKPQLDWFMRLKPMRRVAGFAVVDVLEVVPFALPEAWGSGGLCAGAGGCG